MTTDKLDAHEPAKPSAWAGPTEPTRPTRPTRPTTPAKSTAAADSTVRTGFRRRPFVVASLIGGAATLLLGAAFVFAYSSASDGKVVGGVHAGSVDLSGLSRDEALAKVTADYSSLGQGKVTISTPQGSGTITYQEIGRGPDVAAMVDAAMAVGRYGDPVTNTVERLRALNGGENVPVIVKLDPAALAMRLREITGSSQVPALNASVAVSDSDFTVVPGSKGRGIDEQAIAATVLAQLSGPGVPAELQAGGIYVDLEPQVTDAQAQEAADAAQLMIVDMQLALDKKTWKVPSATVRSWIIFNWRSDGTYGPVADSDKVKAYVGDLATSDMNIDPIQAKFKWDSAAGKLVVTTSGKEGLAVDVESTTVAIATYLDAFARGSGVAADVPVVTKPVQPRLAEDMSALFKDFVVIGRAQVYFYPGEANGFGANIRRPAEIFKDQVVWPGDTFSFWGSLGPVDVAHGFKKGGIIKDGKSDHTGAIGGGICSASTTMFQAAANAGLAIPERHQHAYWIQRYWFGTNNLNGAGLDATVYTNGVPGQGYDLKWRNDTEYPILINSWWTGRNSASSKNYIHIELLSMPTGRQVTFNKGVAVNKVKASDTKIYVKTLAPGQQYRAEYPTTGLDIVRTRTVTYPESDGRIPHTDTWKSHYIKVDGILQIGGNPPTPTPPPTAPPTPSDAPVALPPPVEVPAAALARRRKPR